MPKQEGQKSKLLTLLRILEQKTDEEHLLNVPQLVELLEQQDILAERKSIYSRTFLPSAKASTAISTPCAVWGMTSSCDAGAAAATGWPAAPLSFLS